MGLLDDLLGGLAGQPERTREAAPAGGGGGASSVLMALMPIVLSMLASRGGRGSALSPSGGGGLGDLLGQVLGGAVGGGGSAGAAGGLGSLLEQLQRAGFGAEASSWVGRGPNKPIPADAMTQIFGSGGIEEISRRAGVSEDDARRGLSELLPEVVDRMTPQGDVPDAGALSDSVDDLARRLGIR